jgi:hypothetical protein
MPERALKCTTTENTLIDKVRAVFLGTQSAALVCFIKCEELFPKTRVVPHVPDKIEGKSHSKTR